MRRGVGSIAVRRAWLRLWAGLATGLAVLWLILLPGLAGAATAYCTLHPERCCNGYQPLDPRVCSGHGVCSPPGCTCTITGWTGTWCEVEEQCGTSGAPYFCSSHGECQSGRCQCLGSLGYMGNACDIPLLPQLQPTSVIFGPIGVGGATSAATLILSTWLATNVASIAVTGDAASDFVLGGDCAAGVSLTVQGSCTVAVNFAPTAPGARKATLNIVTSASATPLTAALTGAGMIDANSLLPDPAGSGRLYVGLDGAGVYASDDGGVNWTAVRTQPDNRRVKALAKKSGTPLYAGTVGGGVFKAADGSTAFAACSAQPANLKVLSLAIDGAGRLYAGTEEGAYVSGDACASWTAINGGLP